MAEGVWSGFLRLSLVSCPVRLAPATSDAHVMRLDPLNSRTGNPVTQQFVDSRTGDVVAANAVVRGYRAESSGYVMVTDSELETLAGAPPNIIEVAHFSPRDQIDRVRLETSFYIYPDGQLAADTLDALRLAMGRGRRDAIAYVRLGERERMVLIQPHGAGLMLSTLRPPRVLEQDAFAERAESDIPVEMIEIAETIIGRRLLEADANVLHDRYEDRLRSLIAGKTGGAANLPQAAPAPEPTPAPVWSPSAPRTPPPTAVTETQLRPALPAVGIAPPPVREATPPPPPEPPAPEPEPVVDAAPPRSEPEGSVLSGEPNLEPAAPAPPPEPVQVRDPEPEGAVLSGDPEPAAADASSAESAAEAKPEPEAAAAEAASAQPDPDPEPEPDPEPAEAPAATTATETPEPTDTSAANSSGATLSGEQRTEAERRLFDTPSEAADRQARELGTEILLHIMGLGDRRFVEPGWAGHPGSRRQIEAMSIRPREELEPSAIEFRVFAQEGRATAWVSNGNYAGTRGRQLPLTGFAVRPAPELRDRFDIVYEGCFFDGGVVGPKRNGEICTSPVANDPLEAVRVSIVERQSGAPS